MPAKASGKSRARSSPAEDAQLRPARRLRSSDASGVATQRKESAPQAVAEPSPRTATHTQPDGKCRCGWPDMYAGAQQPEYIAYHDEEWGVPVVDDKTLFEHLVLDGAQCGLSWSTVLRKRRAYNVAFKQWDIDAVAAMTDADIERLLQPEAGIIRHRGKIASAISNAKCVQEVQSECGSFAKYLWSFMPNGRPKVNAYKSMSDLPAKTEDAEAISKALKKRGFKFVGPTMMYAMMQASGMVNDHTVTCFRYQAVIDMQKRTKWPA